VIALDLLTLVLGAGLLVLVVSTTVMVMGMMSDPRRRRPRRGAPAALSPSAAQAVALARKRADAARADLVAVPSGVRPNGLITGQIIDVTDDHDPDRERAIDDAIALAVHVAETDPQRVAEVIRAWIRADLTSSSQRWAEFDELASPPA
jgi:flagellar biosynthesis/type III secretory pathway M-ring protein FliF/YscJ